MVSLLGVSCLQRTSLRHDILFGSASQRAMTTTPAAQDLNSPTGETSAIVPRGLVQTRVAPLGDPCDAHGENIEELMKK